MKHFKLNMKRNYISVADLCITGILEDDYTSVAEAFANALKDRHITFNLFEKEGEMLVAKKIVTSWSISE